MISLHCCYYQGTGFRLQPKKSQGIENSYDVQCDMDHSVVDETVN